MESCTVVDCSTDLEIAKMKCCIVDWRLQRQENGCPQRWFGAEVLGQ